ncbi:ligand-effect modulator 3 [Klebsormidium nitens]|uniref:Ligand-effect modulator 3 n=1 Tax=Klebsormidium nitens TaxID=105231 RepID=A0A1Y1IBS5_KLENI|nr:ligand-effect modulator 3 [Klebsormidium nitens]|eukprot:GAQ86879.1 ligand-effect modulator 3 [Klebsormidium nitens]
MGTSNCESRQTESWPKAQCEPDPEDVPKNLLVLRCARTKGGSDRESSRGCEGSHLVWLASCHGRCGRDTPRGACSRRRDGGQEGLKKTKIYQWVIFSFFIVGVVFIPIGAAALVASRGVVEIVQRYDDACLSTLLNNTAKEAYVQDVNTNKACSLTITVNKDMDAPVYVYYELDNFYQNHRRYVKSRSDTQLRGDNPSQSSIDSSCKPEAFLRGNTSFEINPCGLIAWSYFNDTYAMAVNGANVPITQTGIAWKSDREDKFGAYQPQNFNTVPELRGGAPIGGVDNSTNIVNQDEHFIVWMRVAALPHFRKLWGKIGQSLKKGDVITVDLQNLYNTYSFDGQKKLVLSTTSWLGGKNDFLGIAYLTVGSLSFFLCVVFLLVHLKNPRDLGDTRYLSWNRKNLGQASVRN